MNVKVEWMMTDAVTWQGVPAGDVGGHNVVAIIKSDRFPPRFVGIVLLNGQKLHESERGCLCGAQDAAVGAINKALELRGVSPE